MKKLFLLAAGTTLLFSSCAPKKSESQEAASFKDPLIENMDTTVNPATDFFQYACGRWIKNNPIPGNERSWGVWSLVQNETFDRMRTLSEDAGKSKSTIGSAEQKIGDYYFTGMDSATIEKQGLDPLKTEFDRISAIKDQKDLQAVIALFQTYGISPLFGVYIAQDEKRSEIQTLHFYQGGIGMPEREYYFNTDARTKNIRSEYVKHIANMFTLMGDDAASSSKNAQTIMSLELNLAKASRKMEDLRDPYKNYNKMASTSLKSVTPSIDWQTMFVGMHMSNIDTVIVGQPEFFKEVEHSLKTVSLDDWKTYLRWNLISSFAGDLSDKYSIEHFNFYGKALSGVKEQRPRWKRVLASQENAIGDLLGELYVKKFVSPSVKQRYQVLTDNILQAYRERIQQLTWMTDSTKQKAIAKLNAVMTKVAYPDKFRDYSKLTIDRSSYVANVMRSNVWAHDYQVSKIGKPVDRLEWDMTPQTYNAYYNASNNEIVLPAAMFIIPGLPDTLADDAIIYGYAGASTIGHEITHGFDDEGRQFDAKGNLSNWWSKSDGDEFTKRAQLIIKQFNAFKVGDSLSINGTNTQGENIADLGGVVLGLEAFKKTQQYKDGKMINGLTPVQRFYLGYALSWLGHNRPESLAMAVMTDVHAPNFLRINAPVANQPEFYKAFGVKEGDAMWRPDSLRVNIW